MGSILGSLLSLFIFFICALFFIDLIVIQADYVNLDAISSTICNIFSMRGGIRALDEVNQYIEKQSSLIHINIINDTSIVGEKLEFELVSEIKPLFFLNNLNSLSIKRSVIVGLYNGEFK